MFPICEGQSLPGEVENDVSARDGMSSKDVVKREAMVLLGVAMMEMVLGVVEEVTESEKCHGV